MKQDLENALKRIGKEELGNTTVSPETRFDGEAIALCERENGNKTFVVVAWVDNRLGLKFDPNATGSRFKKILKVYRYEDPKIAQDADESKPISKMTAEEVMEALLKEGYTKDQVEGLGNLTTKREALKRILDAKVA